MGGLSLDALVQRAAQGGVPVIVGVRDTTGRSFPAFAGGHFLIVVGGDSRQIRVVDSSLYRLTTLPRGELLALWTGESVVMTPPGG